jgi:EmrB/QacA subfamily drug resistance transporter
VGYVSFVVTASRLADLYGRRKVFICSVILFAVSSILVGMAVNLFMLLLGRFLQGISAGAMIMVVIALISSIFTGEKKDKHTSTLVAMFGLGTGVGPLLGGVLIHYLSWRYLFFINVPVALFVCVYSIYKLPVTDSSNKNITLDLPGISLLTVCLASFALVVSESSTWGLHSIYTVLFTAVCLLSFLLFYWVETKSTNAIIDFKLFRITNFLTANIMGVVLYICLSSWIIFSGLYFNNVAHYSAFSIGLTYLPFGIALILLNLIIPKLNSRFSKKTLLCCAAISCCLSFVLISYSIHTRLNFILYSVGTLLFGVGFVLINALSVQHGLKHIPANKINIASGISMMLRWVGAAIGPPVFVTLLSALKATSSYSLAMTQCYLVLAGIMLLLLLLILSCSRN